MGGYEYIPCPVCHAEGWDEEEPFLWKGIVYGTGGNDRGYGDCFTCRRMFTISGPPQLTEVTIEQAAKLAEDYGYSGAAESLKRELCPKCNSGKSVRQIGMCANGDDAGNQYACEECKIAYQVPWDSTKPVFVDLLITAELRGTLKKE